ncbi:hypothetical protein Tco_1236149 [Tanacetum coccineum]
MAGSDDEIPPPPQTPTQQAPHTVSTIKLPILKKGEYDIWAMKMEHYLSHIDYPIWEVIQKGNGPVSVSTDTNGVIKVLPPKTAEEILARERERKARTTLLMALPEDHLAKFHKMTDAKDMWDAIKSRFGGNDESKKMQKYILKQQFEGFSVSNSEGLHKGYDRFQSLLSQLEIHGAGVSTEDANQKFLRSLPSSWSQVSLVMRTKPGVDNLSIDDLYNNLRVFESDIKGSTGSSSSAKNVAFVSSESTSSTNDVSTANGVSTSSGYTDELIRDGLEMASSHDFNEIEEVYKRQLKGLSKGNQESKRRDARNTGYKEKDNERRPGKQEEPKTLVTLDGEGVDWTGHAEDEQENFALIAYSNSCSNTEVKSCSKEYVESYAKLKKLYDEQREQLGDASIEIQAYTQALKKDSTKIDKSWSLEDSPVHDRFANVEGMHAVPPPMTGNYIPPGPDREVDDSMFTYGPKQSKTSESDTQTSNFDSCESNSSVETLEYVLKPVVVKPKVVSQLKVWSDAPIIEDFSHLIRDCDFHEKKMAKQVELNKKKDNTALISISLVKRAKQLVLLFDELGKPVRSKNQANKTAGPEEANHSAVKSSEAKNEGEKPHKDTGLKTNEEPVDQEDQAFLEELERLKRQEKEANDAAKALRKDFAQEAEDLLLQAGAARATSTNIVNTVRTPVSTASSSGGPSYPDLTNYADQDDSQIPALKDIYNNPKKREKKMKTSEALEDESWVDAMQEELLQFKIQKKDIRQEEKDRTMMRFLLPVARIEPIEDLFGPLLLIWEFINGYRRGTINKTLFIKKDKNDIMLVQVYVDDIIFGFTKRKKRIFISQDKYVTETLKKFDFASVKTANTLIETHKPLTKDEEAVDVDVHLYRSMIGSLMYLTASRLDIMFAVCVCSRFQVTPKTSHLNAMNRIFRYLKGKPKLGLWYPRVSSFDLEAYSDSDYAGANLDKKSTTGGCQFLGRRLISWQCKKQTIVATSTIEAEYVAAANCCEQVLWIQNQMLDYGFNFMNTKIYIDNESTICIVKNLVFHSKTKHIEIRYHFIGDAYEKKLIQVLKIHTDDNVADLLTKAFDVRRGGKLAGQNFVLPGLVGAAQKCLTMAKLVLPGNVGAARHKVSAARKKFVLLVTVTTVAPEGEGSEQPTEPQPTPSPTQPSTGDQPPDSSSSHNTIQDSRDSLEGTNGSEGDQVQLSYDSQLRWSQHLT